jgi:hypothetical protein
MESPEQPTLLMHYTNAEGLEGILKSKTLRLTHHSCTNDNMETTYISNVLKNLLKNKFEDIPTIFSELSEYISKQPPQDISKLLLANSVAYIKFIETRFPDDETRKKLKPHLGSANIYSFFSLFLQLSDAFSKKTDWYIFSFSRVGHGKNYDFFAQNGRLSQWRAYGNYALVFRRNLLGEALKNNEKHNMSYLGRVKYPGPNLKEISDDFKRFFETHCLNDTVNGQDDLEKGQEQVISWVRLVAFVKHPGFEEENEERLSGGHL